MTYWDDFMEKLWIGILVVLLVVYILLTNVAPPSVKEKCINGILYYQQDGLAPAYNLEGSLIHC